MTDKKSDNEDVPKIEGDTPDLSGSEQAAKPPVVTPPKPEDFGVKPNETVGFIASPTIIRMMLNLISMPKKEERTFPKIVLNFDEKNKRIWWANKTTGSSVINWGIVSYNFLESCWGNGRIAISAARLSEYLEELHVYKELTFWANTRTKVFGIQSGLDDQFTNFTESADEVKSAYEKFVFKLDANYIPNSTTVESVFTYGADLQASELQMIIERGKKFAITQFPFQVSKDGIKISINDIFNPTEKGANVKKLSLKPDSVILPETTQEKPVIYTYGSLLEAPVKNLSGQVTMRFPKVPNNPMFLLKREQSTSGGIFVAGFMIGAEKEKGK